MLIVESLARPRGRARGDRKSGFGGRSELIEMQSPAIVSVQCISKRDLISATLLGQIKIGVRTCDKSFCGLVLSTACNSQ